MFYVCPSIETTSIFNLRGRLTRICTRNCIRNQSSVLRALVLPEAENAGEDVLRPQEARGLVVCIRKGGRTERVRLTPAGVRAASK
jgi:hypothetical protein